MRRWRLEGIEGDRWVIGGRLPPGASRAVLVACTGAEVQAEATGGEWEAVVERRLHPEPVVRFEDAAGNIVRPPLPASPAREPVDVDDEPCFACGGTEWERFDDDQEPVVVCARCGHEERAGVFYVGADDEPVDPANVPRRPAFDLGEVPFPVYALEGARPEVSGWSRDADAVRAVTVRHGDVEVETETQAWEEPEPHARRALFPLLYWTGTWPDRPIPHLVLWLRRREREAQVRAAEAERFALDVPVDGTPVRFEGLRSGACWAMVGPGIAVAGRDLPPERVRLRSL